MENLRYLDDIWTLDHTKQIRQNFFSVRQRACPLSQAFNKKKHESWVRERDVSSNRPQTWTRITSMEKTRNVELSAWLFVTRTGHDVRPEVNLRLARRNLGEPWLWPCHRNASTFRLHAYKLCDLWGIRAFWKFPSLLNKERFTECSIVDPRGGEYRVRSR